MSFVLLQELYHLHHHQPKVHVRILNQLHGRPMVYEISPDERIFWGSGSQIWDQNQSCWDYNHEKTLPNHGSNVVFRSDSGSVKMERKLGSAIIKTGQQLTIFYLTIWHGMQSIFDLICNLSMVTVSFRMQESMGRSKM